MITRVKSLDDLPVKASEENILKIKAIISQISNPNFSEQSLKKLVPMITQIVGRDCQIYRDNKGFIFFREKIETGGWADWYDMTIDLYDFYKNKLLSYTN